MDKGMQIPRKSQIASRDQWLVGVVVSLLSLGAVMVYSSTIAGNQHTLDMHSVLPFKHFIFIALGSVLLIIIAQMKIDWLQMSARAMLLISVLLLVLLLIPGVGVEINGSLRWLGTGMMRFQPSEFVKLGILIYFADYLARNRNNLYLFKVGILNIGLVIGLVGLLLLMQPDFGTTVVVGTTVAGMMFLAGVRLGHFVTIISIAVALMMLIVWMEPYRVERLISYRDPWADPFDSGFQLVQALIAIGRGEWIGVGLGNSIQKLFYLPHAENDFLIAIIGEELGAVGILAVLALFSILLFRSFVIADKAFLRGDCFAGFLAQGIGLLITFQAGIHVGVNTGLLPTKGLTLPLMSYGGSSMLSTMLAVGILLAIDCQNRSHRRRLS